MRHKSIVYGLLCLFIGTSNVFSANLTGYYKKSFPFNPGGEFTLQDTNGKIELESWDKNEIYVEAEKTVKASSNEKAKEIMARVEIKATGDDRKLSIDTIFPKKNDLGSLWDALMGRGHGVNVNYLIKAPKKVNLKLETTNGTVGVRSVEGNIHLETTNGDIQVANSNGPMKLATTNGDIKAESASGIVKANTTNGSITVDLMAVSDNEQMEFRTTNGNVTAHLPRNLRANIEAGTTNGNIETDFPIQIRGKISRTNLTGKIGGGGAPLTFETTNGNIRIHESKGSQSQATAVQ